MHPALEAPPAFPATEHTAAYHRPLDGLERVNAIRRMTPQAAMAPGTKQRTGALIGMDPHA